MKKELIIGLVVFMAFGLSACGQKSNEQEAPSQPAGDAGEKLEEASMLEWLKAGKTVKCEVTTPEGSVAISTKDGAVRMEGVPYYSMDSSGEAPDPANGVMLTVGDWTYMWDKESKKGTMMNMKELEGEAEDMPEEGRQEEWDDMAGEWEDSGYEYECREISAGDDLFEKPGDVEFQDLGKMLEGYEQMGEDMDAMMEVEEFDMEELERMMEEQMQEIE